MTQCYCKNENGGPGKNEIICENNLGIVNGTTCASDEGCTGPTSRRNGIPDHPHHPMPRNGLCKRG